MSDGDDAPSDTLRGRVPESRWKLWFMLEADRWLVTGAFVALVFLGFLAAGYGLPHVMSSIRSGDSVDTLFQALTTATITGVTLVLTLNQLVLSQELGAVGDQRERMQGAMEFREDVADVLGSPVSPARPAQLLRGLVEIAGRRAEEFRDAVADSADEDLVAEVADLENSITENADQVTSELDGAEFGQFEVVSAAVDFNYSWKLFSARYIGERYDEELSDGARDSLESLVKTLELFGPAREHFKTLYFQWELIGLSRAVLGAAVPALVVSGVMVAFVDTTRLSVVLAGVQLLPLVVTLAATVAIVPFMVLLAYVLRIATVTKHTLSIGPFILRDTDRVQEVEWE
ncbi:hypothetical protein [Halorarum salinum]|uniref:Uncharacterized protein n=1 Tax=Halorarum salinum TaxID=2743089 RepID=A0A7D5LAI2_9EURY|nr:hypothetical protein [Halobaculum salinum]QLG61489.1 hypothetical protein HUG12_06985 [Halobaculum salinum]